jgi:hypothetical protein
MCAESKVTADKFLKFKRNSHLARLSFKAMESPTSTRN